MQQLGNKILKLNELYDISGIMSLSGYTGDNISIHIEVPNMQMLQKINESIFYEVHDKEDEIPPLNTNSINVKVGGVNFVYEIKNN